MSRARDTPAAAVRTRPSRACSGDQVGNSIIFEPTAAAMLTGAIFRVNLGRWIPAHIPLPKERHTRVSPASHGTKRRPERTRIERFHVAARKVAAAAGSGVSDATSGMLTEVALPRIHLGRQPSRAARHAACLASPDFVRGPRSGPRITGCCRVVALLPLTLLPDGAVGSSHERATALTTCYRPARPLLRAPTHSAAFDARQRARRSPRFRVELMSGRESGAGARRRARGLPACHLGLGPEQSAMRALPPRAMSGLSRHSALEQRAALLRLSPSRCSSRPKRSGGAAHRCHCSMALSRPGNAHSSVTIGKARDELHRDSRQPLVQRSPTRP